MEHEDSFHIRDARSADVTQIAEFNCAMALETEGKRLDRSVVRAGVEQALNRPELCRYLLAEANDEVVGQIMLTYEWSDWRAGVFWWMQSLYVRPDFRRRGVFSVLYRHVETLARRQSGVCGLRLYVDGDNHQAMRVYECLGLRRSGHLLYECDWSILAGPEDGSRAGARRERAG